MGQTLTYKMHDPIVLRGRISPIFAMLQTQIRLTVDCLYLAFEPLSYSDVLLVHASAFVAGDAREPLTAYVFLTVWPST